jgi:2-hydroxy-6-oxonona-2,4-dienedioate hydrolase
VFARLLAAGTRAALRALGARTTSVEVGGWQIRLHRLGVAGGEPWLMLHGLGATAGTFLPLSRHLRADCDLWLPELSALGGTRGPRAAMGIGEALVAVRALLDGELAGRQPTLCGISLGGWVAIRAAAADPARFARLLAVVPGGYREQDWRRIASMVRVETYADTRALWRALFVAPPWWMRPARLGIYLAYASSAVAATLATIDEAEAFGDEELARLELPAGLVWGVADNIFRVEVGRAMAAKLPNGRLWEIPEAGHGVQWERPREFLAAVEEFRAAFPLPPAAQRPQDPP